MTHKKCIACGHEASANVKSCPKCGEASWGIPFSRVKHGIPEPAKVEAPEPPKAEPPQRRRIRLVK